MQTIEAEALAMPRPGCWSNNVMQSQHCVYLVQCLLPLPWSDIFSGRSADRGPHASSSGRTQKSFLVLRTVAVAAEAAVSKMSSVDFNGAN